MKVTKKTGWRRKKQGKTDYRRRLKLLKSRMLRLVVRKTNKNITAQIVKYSPDGDLVLAGTSSKALQKLGWTLSTNNIPAAYLTGVLIGKKALKIKQKEAILDMGLQTPVKGSKIFAVIKGAIDAGLKINADPEIFPKQERLEGKHISSYLGKESKNFSGYKKKNIASGDIESQVKLLKNKISEIK